MAGNKGAEASGAGGGWIVATDRAGGWVQPQMPSYMSNSALDTPGNRELYEDAFVLLSFSQYYAETGDESVLPWLERTMLRLTDARYYGRAAGGGFNEHAGLGWEPVPGAPRTQNVSIGLALPSAIVQPLNYITGYYCYYVLLLLILRDAATL
jgi:hypothetical protein